MRAKDADDHVTEQFIEYNSVRNKKTNKNPPGIAPYQTRPDYQRSTAATLSVNYSQPQLAGHNKTNQSIQ